MDREKIQKEAKEILDKFARALDKVKISDENVGVDRNEFERVEGDGDDCVGFKENILENAPESDDDFILVEKGDWK